MKTKDYLIVALVPCAILLIPLVGTLTVEDWRWTWSDFVVFWFILAITTGFIRLLVTRPVANLAYKAGATVAVIGGFLLTWVSLAVQVIGGDNPGNLFYFLILLGGFVGVGLSRFQPAALAKVAFGMAAALFLTPIVAVLAWPADFSPGIPQVFALNGGFVLMFVIAGLLFRHSANQGNRSIIHSRVVP
jgi:hypothetical protein